MLWVLFAIRRRYRIRRMEQDATNRAAASRLARAPLDDDDDRTHTSPFSSDLGPQIQMGQRTSFTFSSGPTAGPSLYDETDRGGFDPYAEYSSTQHLPRYYLPARSISPPPGAERPVPSVMGTDEFGSTRDRKSSYGHTPTYSVGSFEPLLAGYPQNSEATARPPRPPPRNPQRAIDAPNARHPTSNNVTHGDSSDESVDDRLHIRRRARSNSVGTLDLRDEDYSRPVLTVSKSGSRVTCTNEKFRFATSLTREANTRYRCFVDL